MKRIVLVTGGFDPLHSGHIAYFKAAKQLGDELVVGVNSDDWLERKKGRPFMTFEERLEIIRSLEVVDRVIGFDDSDDDACHAIFYLMSTSSSDTKIVFANGGDRTDSNIPEYETYKNMPNVEFAFGVGGEDKKNSSSWILKDWKHPKTLRPWGWYRVLDHQPGEYKVKELVIEPGKSLSDQRHYHRSENWYVLKGCVNIDMESDGGIKNGIRLEANSNAINIGAKTWHRAFNDTDENVHILEVQYGTKCIEDDIERRD